MKNLLNKVNEYNRRQIVSGLAKSLLAVNVVPGMLHAAPRVISRGGGKAKSVICIKVLGGLSQVDSFDIKEQNKDAMRGSEPIKSNADGIRVGKFFPKMANHMDKFALINSMYNTQGAHIEARYLMSSSYEKRGTIKHPHLGGWVNKLATNTSGSIPSYIKLGKTNELGSGFFGSKYAALPIAEPTHGVRNVALPFGVSQQDYNKRLSEVDKINRQFEHKVKNNITDSYHMVYEEALKLMQSTDLEVFDIGREKQSTQELYGKNNFGQGCLLARRLVEKGVRFVEVSHDGWDFHYGLYDQITDLAPSLDQGVAALMADLKARGLLDTTMVAVVTEFGRKPELNTSAGRNHHTLGYTCMLAGGGVKGGKKYGKTDSQGNKIIKDRVKVRDFNATIAYAMGLPLNHVEISPGGRPFRIADKGKPVKAIF